MNNELDNNVENDVENDVEFSLKLRASRKVIIGICALLIVLLTLACISIWQSKEEIINIDGYTYVNNKGVQYEVVDMHGNSMEYSTYEDLKQYLMIERVEFGEVTVYMLYNNLYGEYFIGFDRQYEDSIDAVSGAAVNVK